MGLSAYQRAIGKSVGNAGGSEREAASQVRSADRADPASTRVSGEKSNRRGDEISRRSPFTEVFEGPSRVQEPHSLRGDQGDV